MNKAIIIAEDYIYDIYESLCSALSHIQGMKKLISVPEILTAEERTLNALNDVNYVITCIEHKIIFNKDIQLLFEEISENISAALNELKGIEKKYNELEGKVATFIWTLDIIKKDAEISLLDAQIIVFQLTNILSKEVK